MDPVGAMHRAHVAGTQRGSLSNGGNEILNFVAHMPGGRILDIVRADAAMNVWFVVMTILLGVGALILHGYDVRRALIWIAFVWFVPCALLLGHRSEHLPSRRACSLHVSPMMQTTTRRFDFGIAGAVTSCPRLSGCIWRHRNVQRRKRHQLWPVG